MKTFKVLKDFVEVNGDLVLKGTKYLTEDGSGEEEFVEGLLKNGYLEEEADGWKPQIDEKYWYVDDGGCVDFDCWVADSIDQSRLALGNCYKTEKEAQKAADWLKAVAILREDSERSCNGNEANGFGYLVLWNVNELIAAQSLSKSKHNPFLFATEKDAFQSIEEHAKEWKTFLGVERKNDGEYCQRGEE